MRKQTMQSAMILRKMVVLNFVVVALFFIMSACAGDEETAADTTQEEPEQSGEEADKTEEEAVETEETADIKEAIETNEADKTEKSPDEAKANTEPADSNGDDSTEENGTAELDEDELQAQRTAVEDYPQPPQTLEEIVDYPTGVLAGKDFEENKELFIEQFERLGTLDETSTEEDYEAYWRGVVYLMAEDYEGTDNVLRESQIQLFGAEEDEEAEDTRFQFKDNFNVQIILDVSGSMAAQIDGKSMMDIAKDSIREFTASLPEDANVGLRVYGHKGDNTYAGQEESCAGTELAYDIQPYNESEFNATLNQFEPNGWTPIAASLEEALQDFADYPAEENTNVIYLVSDGVETCDGDPIAVAEDIAASDIQPIVNIIGFNLEPEGQAELQRVAEAADGMYSNAMNEDELQHELDQLNQMVERWDEWKSGALADARSDWYDRRIDIDNFSDAWRDKYKREERNGWRVLRDLRDEGVITWDAHSYLAVKVHERWYMLTKFREEMHGELIELRNQLYEEAVEEIEDEYKDNVE